jgi:hypothetical protein
MTVTVNKGPLRFYFIIASIIQLLRRPGSVVGIATAYGLDGPGIESWWGRDFPHLSKETHPASCTMSAGDKVRSGRDADPSTPSSAEVENRVELYLYSP